MADLPCQGSLSSNNSVANSVPRSAHSLSLFPEGLTAQGETLSEVGHQSISSRKSKHKNKSNDSFLEKGSTAELCNISLRLGTPGPKDEDTDKQGDTKIDNGQLPKSRKKQMVTEVSNLEEKRSLDTADSMFGNDISKVMPVRLFNFQSRETSNEPKNLSSAINQSDEPSADIFSMSPLVEQYSCSPYRNDKFMIYTGGVIDNSKTGCPFVPPANSLPVFRTQPISARKPPLPPGAMTYLKGGVAQKTKKVHAQSVTQDSGKHLRVSEIKTKNYPTAVSDKKGCVERGNSSPLYRGTAITDTSRGLTVKSVIFDKVSSAATNSLMNLVTLSDNMQTAIPGSSREGGLSHSQDILPFSNNNMKKTLGSEGVIESDNKNASSLDQKRKCFQRSQYNATGKAHLQSFFEEEDNCIHEFSVGESLCSNVGAALQVSKRTSQNRSGLLPKSSDPIGYIQDPSGSLATSDDQMSRSIAKSSFQNFLHLKSLKADIPGHDREFSIPVSSATEKSRANFLVQQVNSPPANPLHKFVEMQVQASGTSSTASYFREPIVEPHYNAQTGHCQQIGRGQMNSKKRDYDSCTTDYFKPPVIISQAERIKSLQFSSMSDIKQIQHNFHKGAEGYMHDSKSSITDVEVSKMDVEIVQRQFNQIKEGVFKLGSSSEGTVHGGNREVMQSFQDGDSGNSKSENLPPEKSNPSHHNSQIFGNQMDTVSLPSSEFCMDNTQERWIKRLKWTSETDEKTLESTCSEMELDTQRQTMEIPDQCGGLKGSGDSEADRLHHAVGFTGASKEVSEYHRSTGCEKDAQKQHCESHIQNKGDIMTSSLHKHPRCIDHQLSSSFLDDNTLNHTSLRQNTLDPTSHSTNITELQTKVSLTGKGSSSRVQKKIDMASILSHPWIRRWRPSYPIASSPWEIHHSSLVNKQINPRSIPQLFAPMKIIPSAAAMAIVGITAQQFQPCQLQKKGSFSVWTAV